jgi:hypothetical protein
MIRSLGVAARGAFAGAAALLAVHTTYAQGAVLAAASAPPIAAAVAPVPFSVGEELRYKATFGGISAGTARMRVDGIDTVRGRRAYHLVFTVDGGVPFFRVHDRYESWVDVETLSSLRHVQRIAEGRYRRTTTYEIYPERAQYRKDGDSLQASVAHPIDDGSFIYAVRIAGVRVGETRRDDRYFRPDRNPVVLTGLRAETLTVGAGTFATTVVRPTIRTSGMFADDGEAQVWFTDDADRYPAQLKTKFARFTLTLTLQSVTRGAEAGATPVLLGAAGGR